jgi:phosphoglycolate phosphatase
MTSKSVIFDLDGTLIDSQESILRTIKIALYESGLEATIPMTKELVGPPLVDTLSKITAIKDKRILTLVADKFKQYYDDEGYKSSIAYPGIHSLLKILYSQGYTLYVATNKRMIPTLKIIDRLDWANLFAAVYGVDLNAKEPFKNKGEMISLLLADQLIDAGSAIYIGDRVEDYEAAKSNSLACILVDWGYGEIRSKIQGEQYSVGDTTELLSALQRVL